MANLVQKTVQRSQFPSISLDQWVSFFNFGGLSYPYLPQQTLTGHEEIPDYTFEGLAMAGMKSNGVVFSCMQTRSSLFTEARFQFRGRLNGRPGDLYGTQALSILETPWPNGTTGDLLAHAIQDVDIGGNFFVAVRPPLKPGQPNRLVRMRPSWVTIILGSFSDPDVQQGDLDAEVVGYVYHPGGRGSGRDPVMLLPEFVAHWAPTPDPLATFRGMGWMMPIIREFMSDSAMVLHKQKFFENGATPNLVVTLDASIKKDSFAEWVKMFADKHEGAMNAYKTLYLGAGSTVTPVGKDFRQMEFAATQSVGEVRICAAAGVPAILVGVSDGLKSGTHSNFEQAKQFFADATMRPTWRSFCSAMAKLINVPAGSELWYDDRDIPYLRDDITAAAMVRQTDAATISSYVSAGFEVNSIIDAVTSGDLKRLKHTGLVSVQLQPPGTNPKTGEKPGDTPPAPKEPTPTPPAKTGKSSREESMDLLMDMARIRQALNAADRAATPAPNVEVHAHLHEGMVRSETPVTVEVDARTTVEEGAIRADAPQVHVDANTTFEEGAIRGGDIDIEPAELTLADGAIKVTTEIREGTVQVDAPVTVEGHTMELRDGAIHVVTEIQDGAVRVDSPVTIERGAVEIDSPVTVERTEVHVDEGAVQVSAPVTVERTEVEVHVDEGAVRVDAPVTVERTEVHLDPGSVSVPVTVERQDVSVHVDEGAVRVDNPVTIERGAVQVDSPVQVDAPITVERTEVHVDEGAVRLEAPVEVRIEEGAVKVDAPVTVERTEVHVDEGAVRVDAPITVERTEVHIDEGAVKVDSPVTIADGAVRVDSPVTIQPTEVRVDAPITVQPSEVRFEEGSIQVDAQTTIERGAVEVDARTEISEGAVRVDAPVTIESDAVRVEVDVPEPPEVRMDEVTDAVHELRAKVDDLSKPKKRRIVRDDSGHITEITED